MFAIKMFGLLLSTMIKLFLNYFAHLLSYPRWLNKTTTLDILGLSVWLIVRVVDLPLIMQVHQ